MPTISDDPYKSLVFDEATDLVGAFGLVTGVQVGRAWCTQLVGSGAGITPVSGGVGRFGVSDFATGTTITGASKMLTGGVRGVVGGMQWMYSRAVVGIPLVSDGTNTFQVFEGFYDVAAGTLNQSLFQANFLYDAQGIAAGGVASPNWQCWVRDGGVVTVVPLDGATHAGIDTVLSPVNTPVVWPSTNVYDLEVSCVPGVSTVFSINGGVVATLPGPTLGSTDTFGHMLAIIKSLGGTSRHVQCDYMRLAMERTVLPTP